MDKSKLDMIFDGISMPRERRLACKANILNVAARTDVQTKSRRRHTVRRAAAIMLAATLFCSVGAMAAYYGLADKFRLFSFAEEPIDPAMESIVEQYGASVDQSIVVNGVTVTAEAYLADKANLHILYSLEFADEAYVDTFHCLRDNVSVYITDANGKDRGHILGGMSSFRIDSTPGKHYFTKTFALADIDKLTAGSQITLRFTSDRMVKADFDLGAYLEQYPVQHCNWKDAQLNPVSFDQNGITYTVQGLVTSGNDLSILYTIDRKEHAALSEAKLCLYNGDTLADEKMLGGLTAFDKDDQIVYVRSFAIAHDDLANDTALYLTEQHDLTFDYSPNISVTAYAADQDFDCDAMSRALNTAFSDAATHLDDWDGAFRIEQIEVTPLSVTFFGTCRETMGMSVSSQFGFGDVADYYGMRFSRPDGTPICMANGALDIHTDGTFSCSMLFAEPIDPNAPLTIEYVESGETFTLES